jgi:hypothetical protein
MYYMFKVPHVVDQKKIKKAVATLMKLCGVVSQPYHQLQPYRPADMSSNTCGEGTQSDGRCTGASPRHFGH